MVTMFIQNSPMEGPGTLYELFRNDGLDTRIYHAKHGVPETAHEPVVILGGPQSANDNESYLREQEDLYGYATRKRYPYWVCVWAPR